MVLIIYIYTHENDILGALLCVIRPRQTRSVDHRRFSFLASSAVIAIRPAMGRGMAGHGVRSFPDRIAAGDAENERERYIYIYIQRTALKHT